MIRVEYDRICDVLYIKFRDKEIIQSKEIPDDIWLDLDEEGKPVGIEILRASKREFSFIWA